MRYRSDVDGLRAIAVVPVVLFHAGMTPFSGGFTGVDVFFVISGFLITSLIVEEIEQGGFSIIRFYERRVRRILPALFTVVLFSSVAASWLFMPQQFDYFAKSVFATALFVSNVLFWSESGYFDTPASEKPLLHTWSLAVEEQFYILFPLFLFIVHRWLKARWIIWLAPIAALSFGLGVWGVAHKPSATFFLAPTRTWELLLGSLLAVKAFPMVRQRLWLELAGYSGLALIAWGVFRFSAATPFPGANALFPAAGAALVLYSGSSGKTTVGKILSAPPVVFIGLISYSLYLWHWPLLVFAQAWNVYELSAAAKIAIVAVSFPLAAISWRYVELPFRRRTGGFRQLPLFAGAAAATACLVGFGLLGHASHGWPGRLPRNIQEIAAAASSMNPRREACESLPGKTLSPQDSCLYGADVAPAYAVWGDSHADALISMIGGVAARHGQSLKFFYLPGCPPMIGAGHFEHYEFCIRGNDQVLNYLISHPELRTVILISRWSGYLQGYNEDFGPAERHLTDRPLLTDSSGAVLDLNQREALFSKQMSATVAAVTGAGKNVVLVYPVPETGYNIPAALAQMAKAGRDPSEFVRPADYYFRRHKFVFDMFGALRPADEIVRIFPHKRLCNATDCIVYADGKPLYRDDDHLSLFGAEYISDLFEPVFRDRQGARP